MVSDRVGGYRSWKRSGMSILLYLYLEAEARKEKDSRDIGSRLILGSDLV